MEEPTILIADDNLDMIYLIKKGFAGEGYRILEAHDGDEAYEKIVQNRPDLVLLDLKMPRRYGLEVLRDIKKRDELKDIPIIVLTVVSDTSQKIAALENGANDFLLKPPVTAELRARVNTQLKLRNATGELKRYSQQLEKIVEEKTKQLQEYANRLEEMVEEKIGVIKRQNEEHLVDIKSAEKIQKSLLPESMPNLGGIHFFIRYFPCERIGGDFYNGFRIDENTIGFYVADVSGHGVPSAMITVYLKQEISYYAKDVPRNGHYSVIHPREVLRRLNTSFLTNKIGEGTYFVTIVYGTYNVLERKLTLSLAGHHALPVIRRHGGNTEVVEMSGFPIGWFDRGEEYGELSYTLGPGDTLFLYTDGLLDIVRMEAHQCTDMKLYDAVIDLFRRKDVEEAFDRIVHDYREKHSRFEDDVTLVAMSV